MITSGVFLGRIPYARVDGDGPPVLVVAGGQAFMQRPTPQRVERDTGRVAAVLPRGRGFVLLGYDPAGETHMVPVERRRAVAAKIGDLLAP